MREGEVTFSEVWLSALQLGLVRSNFVDTRNNRRYLFAERALGCIPLSWRIRQQAARVREMEELVSYWGKHWLDVFSPMFTRSSGTSVNTDGQWSTDVVAYRGAFLSFDRVSCQYDIASFREKALNSVTNHQLYILSYSYS